MRTLLAVCAATVSAIAVTACGGGQPQHAALTVNGTTVSTQSYDDAVQALRGRIEQRTGHVVNPNTPDGARRLAQVQSTAIQSLVAGAVLDQLAAARHVTVSDADVDRALHSIGSASGNADQLVADLAAAGLSDASTRASIRSLLLQQRLRADDPAHWDATFAAAVHDAQVTVYAAPCTANHAYPACVQ